MSGNGERQGLDPPDFPGDSVPEAFRGVCYYVTDAVIVVDGEGRIRAFNKGAERIFQRRWAEVAGHRLDILIPGADRATHRAHVEAFVAVGPREAVPRFMSERGRVRGLRRDGTEFPAEVTIAAERVGEAVLSLAIVRDLTERPSDAD